MSHDGMPCSDVRELVLGYERRIADLEYGLRDANDQLRRGTRHFEKLDAAVKPMSSSKLFVLIAPGILSMVTMVATLTWAAAQYPDRDEVSEMVGSDAPYVDDKPTIMRVVDRYDTDMRSIRQELESLRIQQVHINAKLDTIINYYKMHPAPRGR